MSKQGVTAKEGCGIMALAIFLMIGFSILFISGLAVIIMFGWGLIAPSLGAQPLDFPVAFGISTLLYAFGLVVRSA